jgi:hypothetical protein
MIDNDADVDGDQERQETEPDPKLLLLLRSMLRPPGYVSSHAIALPTVEAHPSVTNGA